MNESLAYLNGQWIPASAATIPVGDSGFVLGTTVAEQVRTFGGRPFRLDDHLARLEQSLRIIGVEPGLSRERFVEIAEELVARNHRLLDPGDDLGLSIFVTPGTYPSYAGPPGPTVCLHTYPLPFHLWADTYRRGQALVVAEIEQVSSRSWPAALKCRSRMHYYLADRRAAEKEPGARAVLLDAKGRVTEASTANVVALGSAGSLISPPPEKILPGISLAVLAELAEGLGIGMVHRELTPDDLATAEEVFLTSTPVCLLPVARFNGRPIGRGEPGPVYRRLLAAWSERVGLDVVAQAERFAARDLTRPPS